MYTIIGKRRLRVYQTGDNFFTYKRVKEPVPKNEIIYAEVPKRQNKSKEMVEKLQKELKGTKAEFEKQRNDYEARYRDTLEKMRGEGNPKLIDELRSTIDAGREKAHQCDLLRQNMLQVQDALEDTRAQHRDCLENLKNCSSTESQLRRALEEEAKNTQMLVNTHTQRHSELSTQLTALTRDLDSLRQQYAIKEAELASLNAKFREFVDVNTSKIGDTSRQLESMQIENAAKIAELNKACDVRVASESEKCGSDLLQCQTYNRRLQEQLLHLTTQTESLNQEISKHVGGKEASELLEKQMRNNSETIKLLMLEVERGRAKHETLLHQFGECMKERDADEEDIARLTEENSLLKQQMAELRVEAEKVNQLKVKYVADVRELVDNSENALNKLDELDEKLKAEKEQNANLRREVEHLNEDAQAIRLDRHKSLEIRMENVNKAIENTEIINKNTERIRNLRENTLKTLGEKDAIINTWKTKHREAVGVAESLETRIREMKDELHDAARSRQNYSDARKESEVLLERVSDLEKFIDERNEVFRQTENSYTSLRHEVEKLRAQLVNAEEEREQCEVFMTENAELRRDNEHLRQKLNEMLEQNEPISPDELSYD
jgi:chromosome segregation ATPase